MRYTNYKANVLKSKILLFCFLLLPLGMLANNDKIKQEILANTRSEIIKEEKPGKPTRQIIASLDSVLRIKSLPDKDFATVTFRSGEYFREEGMFNPAVELFLNTISYFEQLPVQTKEIKVILVDFYIPLGACHEELGMWSRAMDYYLKALKIAGELHLENRNALIYNNIGNIYYRQDKLGKAESYFHKALRINLKSKNKKEQFNNYNNLAGVYLNQKKYDRALDYSLRAMQTLDIETDPDLYYFMQTNIATLYLQKKDYKLAVSYLRNAMEYQELYRFEYDLIETYYLFAHLYSSLNQHDSARFYIDKTLKQMKRVPNKHLESKVMENISVYYEETNNYKEAYQALKQSTRLKDSILKIDNPKKMESLEKVYDADKKIKENELLISEISLRETASYRLWILMFTITLLLISIIILLISKIRHRENMRQTDKMLIRQKAVLFEKENELQRQKEQELTFTIDQKNRELTSYTLHRIRSNEFMSSLAEDLKLLLLELKPKDRAHKEHLRKVLAKLHSQSCTTVNWDEFRYYFEQVHPSFYENLETYYPNLSIKEKRLCAFLRLGLSTKEISAITFKEVRSVETARNRLRKKLNLISEENLAEFLSHPIPCGNAQEQSPKEDRSNTD